MITSVALRPTVGSRPSVVRPARPAKKSARPTAAQNGTALTAAFGGGYLWSLTNRYTVALPHELGHAVTASSLFEGAHPHISFNDHGALTQFTPGPLSHMGQSLGHAGSLAAVAAAGPMVDATLSAAMFAAGYGMRGKHPIIGGLMMGHATLTMVNDTLYAWSAIGNVAAKAKIGNDFANLAVHAHIPPFLSAAAFAIMLPIEFGLLRKMERWMYGK